MGHRKNRAVPDFTSQAGKPKVRAADARKPAPQGGRTVVTKPRSTSAKSGRRKQ